MFIFVTDAFAGIKTLFSPALLASSSGTCTLRNTKHNEKIVATIELCKEGSGCTSAAPATLDTGEMDFFSATNGQGIYYCNIKVTGNGKDVLIKICSDVGCVSDFDKE